MATRNDWFDGKAAEEYANLQDRQKELQTKRDNKKKERLQYIKDAAAAVATKAGKPAPANGEQKRQAALKSAHLAQLRADEYDSQLQVVNRQLKEAPEWLKNENGVK